ncbi:MAG: hypothetical protein HY681_01815 [Chloroflexi bacterium]|nr:hypothetical protein [Chloroflexota bacterium]
MSLKAVVKRGGLALLAAVALMASGCQGPRSTPATVPTPSMPTVGGGSRPPTLHEAQTLFTLSAPAGTPQSLPVLCTVSPYEGTMAIANPSATGSPCGNGVFLVGPDWAHDAPPLAEVSGPYLFDPVQPVWSQGHMLLLRRSPLPPPFPQSVVALSLNPPVATVPLAAISDPFAYLTPVGWLGDGATAVYLKRVESSLSLHGVGLDGVESFAVDLGSVPSVGRAFTWARIAADGSGVLLQTSPSRGQVGYTRFDVQTRSFSKLKDVSIENSIAFFFWEAPDGSGVVLGAGLPPGESRYYYVPLGEESPRELADVRNGGFIGAFAKGGWGLFGLENRIVAVDFQTGESRLLLEEEGLVFGPYPAGDSAVVYEVVLGETRHIKRALVD